MEYYFKVFTKARYDYLCNLSFDEKIMLRCTDFFKDELLEIINQCAFSDLNNKIAILKKVEKKTNQEISDILGIGYKTVTKHLTYIRHKCIQTCTRLFPNSADDMVYEIPTNCLV